MQVSTKETSAEKERQQQSFAILKLILRSEQNKLSLMAGRHYERVVGLVPQDSFEPEEVQRQKWADQLAHQNGVVEGIWRVLDAFTNKRMEEAEALVAEAEPGPEADASTRGFRFGLKVGVIAVDAGGTRL